MQEQLRNARDNGWSFAGIVPFANDEYGELGSVNERRAFEALRLAADITYIKAKPGPVEWIDRFGKKRTYSPDARVDTIEAERSLVEIKPAGYLSQRPDLRAKYEDIGSYLQSQSKLHFGLLEWQWDSILARNVARLSRYWAVDPENVARRAFEEVGNVEVTLAELFRRVESTCRPQLWAGIAHQHLAADLDRARLSESTRLSLPGVIYEPLGLAGLITTWWA